MQGYCVRCRTKQNMLNPTRTLMKNGRRAMIGLCECCGTKMSVAGKWDNDGIDTISAGSPSRRADMPARPNPSPRTAALK